MPEKWRLTRVRNGLQLERRWSEKAWGKGGALELNPKHSGVCLLCPSLFSNPRKTGFLYKSKHTAFPAHKIMTDSEPLMYLRKSMMRILSLGTVLVFSQAISSKNFISIFQVEIFSAWRKRKMVTGMVSYPSWSHEGNGGCKGHGSPLDLPRRSLMLFPTVWFSGPSGTGRTELSTPLKLRKT